MRVGDLVRTSKFGDGKIVELGPGQLARVDLGYTESSFPTSELALLKGAPDKGPGRDAGGTAAIEGGPATGTPDRATLADGMVVARRSVLALKLGQVLEDDVLGLSIGTADIQRALERVVEGCAAGKASSILVKGAWGSGKSHALTMLQAIASSHDFALASIILDGEGRTLAEPMGLMEALLGSLRFPGEPAPTGVARHIRKLRVEHTYRRVRRYLPKISAALFALHQQAFDEPEVAQVLEDYWALKLTTSGARTQLRRLGHSGSGGLPSLKAQKLTDRGPRFVELLTEWAHVAKLSGARGLVVVIDELDVDYARTVGRPALRVRRDYLLKALRSLFKGNVPILIAFASAPAGAEVQLADDAVRDLQAKLGGLGYEIDAPVPTMQEMCELADRLTAVYERAYPGFVPPADRRALSQCLRAFAEEHDRGVDPIPRRFVRGVIERLDVAHLLVPPDGQT